MSTNDSKYFQNSKIILTRRKSKANVYKFFLLMTFDMLPIEKLFRIKTKRKFTSSSSCCIYFTCKQELIRKQLLHISVLKCRFQDKVILFYDFLFLWTPSLKIVDIISWHFDVMHYHLDREMKNLEIKVNYDYFWNNFGTNFSNVTFNFNSS